jgi:hypothetical protein
LRYDAGVLLRAVLPFVLLLLLPLPLAAQDQLSEARRLYNAGQYEAAEKPARTALAQPRTANSARIVLARILLERYRQSATPALLIEARDALRHVSLLTLESRERVELMLGFAQGLFLEDRFLAAADVFEPIVGAAAVLGPVAHDRALDWWATALDRHAASRPFPERSDIYARIARRMADELVRDPGSGPANYWLVAAAHGSGDLDGAWSAAQAAWIRAGFAPARADQARADIDRVVMEGIIPARAARIGGRDTNLVVAGMVGEWDVFKKSWSR